MLPIKNIKPKIKKNKTELNSSKKREKKVGKLTAQ